MRRRLILSSGLAATIALAATPALACRVAPSNPWALIHAALPNPLPSGAIVAEVEFDRDSLSNTQLLHHPGVRARVRRVIQGHYRGSSLIVRRTGMWTDCDRPAANGTSGLIVARPVGFESGVLVVEPILVPAQDRFRLPDGFQLERR